ncbi:MAG: hypothetical protein RSB41_00955 [Bacilli bacterium]
MKKNKFLKLLKDKLILLKVKNIDNEVKIISDIIDKDVDNGLSEYASVKKLGSIDILSSSIKDKKSKKNKKSIKFKKYYINKTVETEKVEKEIKNFKLNNVILILEIFLSLVLSICLLFTVASLYSLLDGSKMYGLSIFFTFICVFLFYIIFLLHNINYEKKIGFKFTLIFTIICICLSGTGAGLFLVEVFNLENVSNVSSVYIMSKEEKKYPLPTNGEKYLIYLNSKYKTNIKIIYDDELDGMIKVSANYYDNYYNLILKSEWKNLYISFHKDYRDIISTYLDGFREGKSYNMNELQRYTLTISINEKDKDIIGFIK